VRPIAILRFGWGAGLGWIDEGLESVEKDDEKIGENGRRMGEGLR